MCDLYERIESYCKLNGIKIADLARETNFSKTTFSDLKNGRTKTLSMDKLIIIADFFDISLDELVGRKKRTPDAEASEVQNEIIKLFTSMTEEQQNLFYSLALQLILQGSKD